MERKKVKVRHHKEEVEDAGSDIEEGDMWLVPSTNENSNSGEDGGDYVSMSNDDDLLVEIRRGRSNPYWTQEIEQIFIERIKSYPPLYDHSNENWKNTKVKDVIWEEISIDVGIPANECRRHFKHMRDKFVRHKRTGRGSRTWKAGEAMNFLVEMDLIKHRPKNANDLDVYGPLSPEKSRSDEMSSSPPPRKVEIIEESNGISMTVAPPTLIPSRSLRSMKRKVEEQCTTSTLERIPNIQGIPKDTILEFPSTINSKVSLRKPSSDRMVMDGHLDLNGHSLDARSHHTILPSQQLLLTPIPTTITNTTEKVTDRDPIKSGSSHGPNYYFGQYIASVLDALPQGESLMTRHKLQEILFDAQRKAANPPLPQVIQFQCTNCTNRFTPI